MSMKRREMGFRVLYPSERRFHRHSVSRDHRVHDLLGKWHRKAARWGWGCRSVPSRTLLPLLKGFAQLFVENARLPTPHASFPVQNAMPPRSPAASSSCPSLVSWKQHLRLLMARLNWSVLSSSFLSKLSNSKNSKQTVKTPGIDCDSEQSNRKHQKHHKHELWLGITFYTTPKWAPYDPAG